MKKILITGANSYIGTSLEQWLGNYIDKYSIHTICMKNDTWKEKDFSKYDVVFHVAGIAHVSSDPKLEEMYYKVNRDLTIEVAKKAKAENVKQFIFMSSIIVYGDQNNTMIDRDTIPVPNDFYGNSKLQAEEGIKPLESEEFKVVIVRPPMIYGKESKGNYPKLAKLAQMTPLFPDVNNKRSMLHIDNLCEFLRLMIDHEESGVFFPQNSEYVKTSEMVKLIAEVHGKKILLMKMFNPILRAMRKKSNLVNKVFGDLAFEQSISEYKENYRVRDFRESIVRTECEVEL